MITTPQRVLDKIGKGVLAPGYLLLGRELYWRDRIWLELRRAIGFEQGIEGLSEMDLRQSSLDAMLGKACERSLWAPRQLILVRNAHALSGAKPMETLADYFRKPSEGSVLVFEMMDTDLESEDWREREKAKARQESWERLCEVVLLMAPPMAEAIELVRREAAERRKKISPQAAENLVALLDRDLGRIIREVEKLCLYCSQEGEISVQDVDCLVGSRAPSNGLSLIDAIGSGDASKVLEAFNEQVPRGAYLPLVLSDITRYLRQLLLLQEAKVRDPRDGSKLLWSSRLPAPQPLLPELLRQARTFPPRHLSRSFQRALEADLALRSSPADDRVILERYLLDLAKPLWPKNAAPQR
jgi:DNA polymerase III subunit delta